MSFQITSYSTALFSTWTFVEELGLLIDAGDGVSAALLQKARKIKHAFITHPDRDHLTGLLQLLQLNSWHGYPKIYYPKDTGSFPAFEAFHRKFNPHVRATDWYGIEDGSAVEIKPNIWVEAQRNEHIAVPQGVNKSLSYKVFTSKRKLKPEFAGLSNAELQRLAIKEGREALTEEFRRNVISFSGDTPVDDYDKWDQSEILIHEATFLQEEPARSNKTYNQHSLLE
ncbi:MAG: MBL fold metallo-hydrolase, partial [Bacteroidota bacterium]